VKKIKKFKINIRLRDTMRLLKTAARIPEITPEIEDEIHRQSRRMSSIISPAALYDTLPREKFPAELVIEPPENWVAASVYLATIGEAAQNEIMNVQNSGAELTGQVLHSIALESLDQGGNFVRRLIEDEAKGESCELSRQKILSGEAAWQKLLELLPGDKIGVSFIGGDRFSPLYSTGGVIFWSPLKKRR
jgi:hypothetical protein